MKKKYHYYCFVFEGGFCAASTYVGYPEKDKITKRRIEEQREYAGINGSSVLSSVSYLGHMTVEEFNEEPQ